MHAVDADVVDVSNKNRQLPALDSTVGEAKADVVAKRLLDINPELGEHCDNESDEAQSLDVPEVHALNASADLNAKQVFVQPDSSLTDLVQSAGDLTYVVDAIDTIAPKCQLLETAVAMGIKASGAPLYY